MHVEVRGQLSGVGSLSLCHVGPGHGIKLWSPGVEESSLQACMREEKGLGVIFQIKCSQHFLLS